jgi:glycosyltransferase involved in cell wall biosynthesis
MVSVVVPVYNGEKFIEQTYAQLAAAAAGLPDGEQTELLFVDDGSTDSGAALLDALAAADSRVRVIHRANGGIASARNTGLEQARGEYICFVDQDDFIKPDMLSVLYADLVTNDADFVQAGANTIRDGAESPVCEVQSAQVVEYGTERYAQYLRTLVMRGLVHYADCEVTGSVWCCMFRRGFLVEYNISFYSFCDYEDDWIFLTLAMTHTGKFCMETKTVYTWRIHGASESHDRVEKDRYIDGLYDKHRLLQAFFWEALKHASLTDELEDRFACELQKQTLLWSLSNETGRGIEGRSEQAGIEVMTHVVEREKYEGICRHINRHPLYISVAGATGWKRRCYAFRDKLLTFLLLHRQIPLAVRLNRRLLHGRWHI